MFVEGLCFFSNFILVVSLTGDPPKFPLRLMWKTGRVAAVLGQETAWNSDELRGTVSPLTARLLRGLLCLTGNDAMQITAGSISC